ncbi:hypothetical protein HPC49_02110 [Pyxidicoccus fallax]|uniref:Uncharacterized protein n=1 Tax=Pyxidicoccus fallax TaxID=394095 RepID=A0A848LFV4_9BACT|nr:hypothetical protein [Pyxidicoccus fallax]NMO14528.1 hypothetical protein [Pyxidicoccus fallax]NPC77047.1 hypothetical protein [Pyxidicoccus fallax]
MLWRSTSDSYKIFQSLAAARIAESIRNSAQAAKHQDGGRYFFGHRIPD